MSDPEWCDLGSAVVRESTALREGAEALADRALALAATLLDQAPAARARGGRKACRLDEPAPEG